MLIPSPVHVGWGHHLAAIIITECRRRGVKVEDMARGAGLPSPLARAFVEDPSQLRIDVIEAAASELGLDVADVLERAFTMTRALSGGGGICRDCGRWFGSEEEDAAHPCALAEAADL